MKIAAVAPATATKTIAEMEPDNSPVEPELETAIPAIDPVQADLLEPELGPLEIPEPEPKPEPEPEPQPVEEPEDALDETPSPDRGKIVKQGDIRGYPFHLYENGEIELETKSGWHTFGTIEEVESHLAAEARLDQESDGK